MLALTRRNQIRRWTGGFSDLRVGESGNGQPAAYAGAVYVVYGHRGVGPAGIVTLGAL